jgi:tetratricopeptide (TPR) repeat protein
LAEGILKGIKGGPLERFFLEGLATASELIGELEKAQGVRLRLSRIRGNDVAAAEHLQRAALLALALGNNDLAANILLSVPSRFPASPVALEAGLKAGDLFLSVENKKRAFEAYDAASKVTSKASRGQAFKALASKFLIAPGLKTGDEPGAKSLAAALGKLPSREREEFGKPFTSAIYELLKLKCEREIDEPLPDVPIDQFMKVKQVRTHAIQALLGLLETSGDDEFVMAGTFHVGKLWAELQRQLRDNGARDKREERALLAAMKGASNSRDTLFRKVANMLDGDAGNYATSKGIREEMAFYLPAKYSITTFPILTPTFSRHVLDVEL